MKKYGLLAVVCLVLLLLGFTFISTDMVAAVVLEQYNTTLSFSTSSAAIYSKYATEAYVAAVEERAHSTADFLWPVPEVFTITSKFGPRNTGIPGASTNHGGIDIGAMYDTPIVAAAAGVVEVGADARSGNYVRVVHSDILVTSYCHMSKPTVTSGQKVEAGEVIGLVGSTGVSSGPHLHFAVRVSGSCVDPANYSYDGYPGGLLA